jgi:alpha-L-rhamnosidase
LKNIFWTLCACVISLSGFTQSSALRATDLRCENLKKPIGIDTKTPGFSWKFIARGRNKHQSAYEIELGDSANMNNPSWSSGKIISEDNILIRYGGSPLQSFTRYYWHVKIYDENDSASDWTAPVWFETAVMDPSDWNASWISDSKKNPQKPEDYYLENRMPLFRKTFNAAKPIKSARLYVSGLGYYEAYLNGKQVGDQVLDPGFTKYSKTVLYSVYNVTTMLHKGENLAAVSLGSGWWDPLPMLIFGRYDLRKIQETGRPCVRAMLRIVYNDDSTEFVSTDASWITAPGPVVNNSVYLGETYDARLEQKNWNRGAIDSTQWENATVVKGPGGTMFSQMQPPIRITKEIKPVKIKKIGIDSFLVDMGQNFAGVVRIKLKGDTGRQVGIRYGEDTMSDGTLNYMTTVATQIKGGGGGPGAPDTAWQQDNYILKGGPKEVWHPSFTFHGFRYLLVMGWPGTPKPEDITGLRMNSDLDTNGDFACSNQMYNQIHKMVQWTFLSNVFSVQSDCPGREKMGYGGDMVGTANAFIYNYDMFGFYSKAIHDFADEQLSNGAITEIAPFTGIADMGYGGNSGPLGWQLAFPYLQDQLYEYYGDKNIIATYYQAFKKQMEFLQSKAVNNLFSVDIGDHETLDSKPVAFNAACFYYHHVLLAEKFSVIMNDSVYEKKMFTLAGNIKQAIVNKYYNANTGAFDNGSESSQAFGLWYGLSPDKQKSLKVLIDAVRINKGHISTGLFSTKMLLNVLTSNGLDPVAYAVTTKEGFPGWGYMISKGATTIWERWAETGTVYSQNHPMFGSIDAWFYNAILGITPAEPGFKTILIKPRLIKQLIWAGGTYHSVMGDIVSSWKKSGIGLEMKVTIPPNTRGLIYVPCAENAIIYEGKTQVSVSQYQDGFALLPVGSGAYTFRTALAADSNLIH